MPKFRVVLIEKFVVRTTYEAVEAADHDEAEQLAIAGKAAYDNHEILEGDEEFIRMESVEELLEDC